MSHIHSHSDAPIPNIYQHSPLPNTSQHYILSNPPHTLPSLTLIHSPLLNTLSSTIPNSLFSQQNSSGMDVALITSTIGISIQMIKDEESISCFRFSKLRFVILFLQFFIKLIINIVYIFNTSQINNNKLIIKKYLNEHFLFNFPKIQLNINIKTCTIYITYFI